MNCNILYNHFYIITTYSIITNDDVYIEILTIYNTCMYTINKLHIF